MGARARTTRPARTRTRRGTPTHRTSYGKKAITEAIFRAYGLPGWLGWGTAGAESTYGTNGSYAFGGIDLPNSGGHDFATEARESAKAYARLVKQYGSISAAVPHYSGNSYTLSHVKQLARGGQPQAREGIPTAQVSAAAAGDPQLASFWGDVQKNLPFPFGTGPSGEILEQAAPSIEGVAGSLLPPPIVNFFSIGIRGLELLIDVHFWIRVGEVIAGLILIHMGLKELTGQGFLPGDPKGKIIDGAAALAAVK